MIGKEWITGYSKSLKDILEKSNAEFSIQKNVLEISEITDPDGLMVIFACLADHDIASLLGRSCSLILKESEPALVDYEVAGATTDLSLSLFTHFTAKRIEELLATAAPSEHVALDEAYEKFHGLMVFEYFQTTTAPEAS